jgi:hypothetical protein
VELKKLSKEELTATKKINFTGDIFTVRTAK